MTSRHFVPSCPRCGSRDISEYVNGMPDFIYYENSSNKVLNSSIAVACLMALNRIFTAALVAATIRSKNGMQSGVRTSYRIESP